MVQFVRGDVGSGLSGTLAPRRSCFLSARLPAWYRTFAAYYS